MGLFVGWFVGWFVCLLVGVDWLVGSFVGCLVGRLVGVDCLVVTHILITRHHSNENRMAQHILKD